MKPIFLVINKDNKIELTADQLQEIIDEAYKQGKEDASKATISQPTETTKVPYWWERPYPTWISNDWSDNSTSISVDAYAESTTYNY